MQTNLVRCASSLAKLNLGTTLPRRWRHVEAVAAKADALAATLPDPRDQSVLVASAVLHDVGYAPKVASSGFHPLDGARWLRAERFDDRVAALVAHHTNALAEAELRGLDKELSSEFVREVGPVADLLWYCDLTTGPDGQDVTVEERVAEVQERYVPGSVVYEFISASAGEFFDVAERVEARLQER
ncbi:HD domain-containing protein [Glycomyces sp. YM15]|uniref:HD domain-containing protein n=1 Tax=Glycomyces sp. YM15 TaxID=2800446 RepID=UPI0027DE855A|nr:HD domain-containing protein [Glycomyces sp. YM15]